MGSGGVQIREVPLYTCTIVTMYLCMLYVVCCMLYVVCCMLTMYVCGKLDIKNDEFTFAVGKVLVE